MRRTIILPIIALCLFPLLAEAQLIRSFGIKAGTAAASENWQYSQNPGLIDPLTRWGLDVGGFVEWFNIPILSVSSEVHYVQKGFRLQLPVTTAESPDGNGSFLTLSPRVDYLSMPLLAKCRLDLESSSIYVLAGPRLDIFLSTKDVGFGDVLKKFRSNEFGFTMGVGCEAAKIGPLTLGLEARYSPTLQDSYSTNLLAVRNQSFEMLLVISH